MARPVKIVLQFLSKQNCNSESFYLRRSRQIRERKVLFFFFFLLLLLLLLLLLGDLGGLFSNHPCTVKMGASRENYSSKWVHPEKTFFQNDSVLPFLK